MVDKLVDGNATLESDSYTPLRGLDKHAGLLLTFAQCKARAQKTANILKLFSSVLVKALPFSLFTICTTPITVPRLTMGMHRMFRVV